jgi:hypothetical protein
MRLGPKGDRILAPINVNGGIADIGDFRLDSPGSTP